MNSNCKQVKNMTCCRDEEKAVRYAMSALEKLQDIIRQSLDTAVKPDICNLIPHRETRVSSKTRRTSCGQRVAGDQTGKSSRPDDRSDRDAMRLLPGQVGLRGDRATFHLGPSADTRAAVAGGWRPTYRDRAASAVYYSMVPGAAERREAKRRAAERREAKKRAGNRDADYDDDDGGDVDAVDQPAWRPKSHVMRIMPSLPAPRGVAVGPVTGLPVAGDDHVFVLRVDKQYHEWDDKARLEMEVRLPKYRVPVTTSAGTQYDAGPEEPEKSVKTEKKTKNKKNKKKKGAKK